MPHACTTCGRTFPDGSKEMLSGCPDCGGNKFRYHPDGVTTETHTSDRAPPDPDDEGLPARDQGVVDRATTTVREWVGTRSTPSGAADTASGPDARTRASDSETSADPAADSPDSPAADSSADPSPNSPGDPAADSPTDPPAGSTTTGTADDVADAGPASESGDAPEDTAQADARAGVVDPDEIPEPQDTDGDGPDLGSAEERAAAVAGGSADDRRTDATATGSAEPADPTATPSASNLAQLREELNEQFESIKIVEPGQYELNLMGLYDREEYIISLMEDGRYAIEVPETWRDAEDLPDE